MFDYESERNDQNEFPKIYNGENNFPENNILFYEKSENFQESFFQTFNEQLYNENCKISEPPVYSDGADINKYVPNRFNYHNDSLSTLSSSKSTHQHDPEEQTESLRYIEREKVGDSCGNAQQLGGKRGRPMTDKSLIIDEITNKVYDPEVDPEEYRKARKRIQNRESAVRSRMKKKENNKQFEAELDFLRKENYRLNFENSSLKRERVFLFDQIKFLQSIVKKDANNNSLTQTFNREQIMKTKDENVGMEKNQNEDLEKNTQNIANNKTNNRVFFGTYKKPSANKMFTIGVVCIISLIYVSMNSGGENGTISFSSDYTVTMKENIDPKQVTCKNGLSYGKVFAFSGILFVIMFLCLNFYSYFTKKIEFFKTKFIKNS